MVDKVTSKSIRSMQLRVLIDVKFLPARVSILETHEDL